MIQREDLFKQCFASELSEAEVLRTRCLRTPVPIQETERIQALRSCGLLDTAAEPIFDRHTSMCSRIFKVRYI